MVQLLHQTNSGGRNVPCCKHHTLLFHRILYPDPQENKKLHVVYISHLSITTSVGVVKCIPQPSICNLIVIFYYVVQLSHRTLPDRFSVSA